MIHDLFIPCRIGNYFLHKKRVLTIEITPVVIQAILIEYSGKNITVQDQYLMYLKEYSQQAQINAIKKIVSSAGKVDHIISMLASSAMIFKELELPFLDKETLKVVIPFEIENILPFALDQVTIDFIITEQNLAKKSSTVLICAAQKHDIDEQYELFKKADVSLEALTVDVFGLYYFYKNLLQERQGPPIIVKKETILTKFLNLRQSFYNLVTRKKTYQQGQSSAINLDYFHPKRSEMLVDIGYKTIKVLYIKDGVIHGVRIIPLGLSDSLEHFANQGIHSYQEILQNNNQLTMGDEFKNIFDELSKTFLYFQQQDGATYVSPYKIYMTGFYTSIPSFIAQAQTYFGSVTSIVSVSESLKKIHATVATKVQPISEQVNLFANAMLWYYEPESNLLQDIAEKKEFRTLTLQLCIMVLVSLLSLGGIWWISYAQMSRWQSGYTLSRKQLVKTLQEQMNLDVHGEKKIAEIAKKAEEELKRERKLWFSFMKQNETSPLEYLQDLSMAVDRESIGLELKTVHIDYQKVTMTGTVKSLTAIDLFNQELESLKTLKLVNKPLEREFNIELKSKIDQEGAA
jgi:Tfp pilus assembly PilM family ATPase